MRADGQGGISSLHLRCCLRYFCCWMGGATCNRTEAANAAVSGNVGGGGGGYVCGCGTVLWASVGFCGKSTDAVATVPAAQDRCCGDVLCRWEPAFRAYHHARRAQLALCSHTETRSPPVGCGCLTGFSRCTSRHGVVCGVATLALRHWQIGAPTATRWHRFLRKLPTRSKVKA